MLIVAMSISSFTQYCFGLIDKILLSADQKGYIQYAVQIICNVLNVMVISYLIYKKCSIQSVKFASAAVFLIGPIIIRCYINKKYKIDRKIKYDEEPVKQKWNGIAQHIANVILEGTDIIILTTFSTLSNVSVYSVYFMVISGVRQLYTSITAGVQSMIGTLWAKNEIDNLKDVFLSVEIILHFIVVFLFSCIAVLIVPFVKVYTLGITDYEYVKPVFALILTLAYAVRCLRVPYNILILAGGHYKQTQTCHIVAAILNIIVSIVGVILWGIVGIAIGTLVAYVYQTLWMVVYNSKNLLHWPIRNVAKQIVIDVFTVALIYLATMWINMKEVSYIGWFTMAIMVAAIAMIITITMLILFYRTQLKKMYRMIKQ